MDKIYGNLSKQILTLISSNSHPRFTRHQRSFNSDVSDISKNCIRNYLFLYMLKLSVDKGF